MPERVDVVISVPYGDRDELGTLITRLDQSSLPMESRSLDGVTIATVIATISTASVAALKDWLTTRLEARKGCVVSLGGISMQGYSAGEVETIVRLLNNELGGVNEEKPDA